MKVFEIITKCLSESILLDMAFNRKDVESNITSLADPVIEHLIKILKWKDEANYKKHIGDINSWIFKIQRLKLKGNKKPNQHDYYQWMFLDLVDNEIDISRWIKGMYSYNSLTQLRPDEEVYNIIKAIMYKISFDLPLNNFDDISDYL